MADPKLIITLGKNGHRPQLVITQPPTVPEEECWSLRVWQWYANALRLAPFGDDLITIDYDRNGIKIWPTMRLVKELGHYEPKIIEVAYLSV
jgi:hypothetical protein